MSNEQLLTVEDKNNELAIVVPIPETPFGSGLGSDAVPNGFYAAVITNSWWEKSKKKAGTTNMVLQLSIDGPDKYRGSKITSWLPAPIGDVTDEDYEKRLRQFQSLYSSILTGLGKFEATVGKSPKLSPKAIIGKKAFIETELEEYKGREASRLRFFISADQYAGKPGPAAGAVEPGASKSNGANGASASTEPDLLDEAGAADKADTADAMDDLLG